MYYVAELIKEGLLKVLPQNDPFGIKLRFALVTLGHSVKSTNLEDDSVLIYSSQSI